MTEVGIDHVESDSQFEDIDNEPFTDDELAEVNQPETFKDRIHDLKYMFPYIWRKRIYAVTSFTSNFTRKTIWFVANATWILTTSVLLIGLPLFLEYDREQSVMEYEKEHGSSNNPVHLFNP